MSLFRAATRRFLSTGRSLQQETRWPNKKKKLGWYELHQHGEDLAPEKIMPKSHFVFSLLAIGVAGFSTHQYIMYTQKFRVKKKKAELEV